MNKTLKLKVRIGDKLWFGQTTKAKCCTNKRKLKKETEKLLNVFTLFTICIQMHFKRTFCDDKKLLSLLGFLNRLKEIRIWKGMLLSEMVRLPTEGNCNTKSSPNISHNFSQILDTYGILYNMNSYRYKQIEKGN